MCAMKGSSKTDGPVRDLNPGPLAPKARIIPLDQQATLVTSFLRNKEITTKENFITDSREIHTLSATDCSVG